MMFGDVRISFNILFLKIEKLSEFVKLLSSLLDSVAVDGKYEYLEKECLTLN